MAKPWGRGGSPGCVILTRQSAGTSAVPGNAVLGKPFLMRALPWNHVQELLILLLSGCAWGTEHPDPLLPCSLELGSKSRDISALLESLNQPQLWGHPTRAWCHPPSSVGHWGVSWCFPGSFQEESPPICPGGTLEQEPKALRCLRAPHKDLKPGKGKGKGRLGVLRSFPAPVVLWFCAWSRAETIPGAGQL